MCLATLLLGTAFVLTTVDPIRVTIVSVVLGAAAIPLTYLPILVTANDRDYLGDRVNGWFANTLGVVVLAVMVAVSLASEGRRPGVHGPGRRHATDPDGDPLRANGFRSHAGRCARPPVAVHGTTTAAGLTVGPAPSRIPFDQVKSLDRKLIRL